MSEQHTDPSGNTQAFRAFVQSEEESPQSSAKLPLIIGGVLVAALVLALIVWLAR
ncbi:MAG TPA: hypothetical protein VFX61_01105 [Micromonosporaceae bacterium]|nr:hypothetical protein [Micromonosporaceae bacterium]